MKKITLSLIVLILFCCLKLSKAGEISWVEILLYSSVVLGLELLFGWLLSPVTMKNIELKLYFYGLKKQLKKQEKEAAEAIEKADKAQSNGSKNN